VESGGTDYGGMKCGGTDYGGVECGGTNYGGLECGGMDIVHATALHAADRQQSVVIIPHAAIHSLAPLKTGQDLLETC